MARIRVWGRNHSLSDERSAAWCPEMELAQTKRTVNPDSDGGLLLEEGSLLCRLLPPTLPPPPPFPPCRLDVREPGAAAAAAAPVASNRRSCRDGICFFIDENRLSTPPADVDADADDPWSPGLRTGEKPEEDDAEVDVDRVDDEVVAADDRKEEGLDGVVLPFADAGVDSNRLPRVDLSEDAMLEVADAASFALSFSCGPRLRPDTFSTKKYVYACALNCCVPPSHSQRGGCGEGSTRYFLAQVATNFTTLTHHNAAPTETGVLPPTNKNGPSRGEQATSSFI